MLLRILSSIIAFPILAYIIYWGGLPLKLCLMLLSVLGMFEIYRAFDKKHSNIHYISYFFILIYYLLLDYKSSEGFIILIFFYTISNLLYLIKNNQKITPVKCAENIFGFFYVGMLMSGIYLTRMHNYGVYSVWLIFISAWGSDTFAYFVGTTFGKHKIAPKLSPHKTVEGCIGGVLGATFLAFLYGYAVNRIFAIEDIDLVLFFVIIGCAGSVFSQLGDLTASAIKRYTKIKDYGKIIPGHGGIMDRFDSVLFTAPIAYAVMYALIAMQGGR